MALLGFLALAVGSVIADPEEDVEAVIAGSGENVVNPLSKYILELEEIIGPSATYVLLASYPASESLQELMNKLVEIKASYGSNEDFRKQYKISIAALKNYLCGVKGHIAPRFSFSKFWIEENVDHSSNPKCIPNVCCLAFACVAWPILGLTIASIYSSC